MNLESFFEYQGGETENPGYTEGAEYSLEVISRNMFDRITGIFLGVPISWIIVVVSPLPMVYKSIETFSEEWKIKFVRYTNE